MIDGTINGLAYLYGNGIHHGSLRLANIYVNSQGCYKVADPPLFNYTEAYRKVYSDRRNREMFLSPE